MSLRQAVLRARPLHTAGPMLRRGLRKYANWAIKGCGITVIGLGLGVAGFFAFDAMTYHDSEARGVRVAALALEPERGGPKNLPIASQFIDENDDESAQRNKDKLRLVVLGSGWGAVSLIQRLNPDNYNVIVISPSNYFLFTPLLPSATVGTVELRSIVEPIRKIVNRVRAHYLEASAQAIDFGNKLIEVSDRAPDGTERSFYVPYDKLVISVGAAQNTHGVDGLEHCHYLKTVQDCQKIRRRVMDNFEQAVLPVTTEEERKRLLSFVVCGGGPTGVEFAAELFDMINEDLSKFFPRVLRNESRSHILNTYDATISEYAERKFAHDDVDVQINARVQKVLKDKVIFSQKMDGKEVTKEIPFGLCLWSTGVSLAPITQQICENIEAQQNKHAIETDSHLRVIGLPLGDVYAIGDCSTVQNNVADHVMDFIKGDVREQVDTKGNCEISLKDLEQVATEIKRSFPQASDHLAKLDKALENFDVDKNGKLDLDELKEFLVSIDKKLTSLPATAQRAHQQGTYLAKKFNILARTAPIYEMNEIKDGDIDAAVYKAFQYHHLGSLAYLGNSAVGDLPGGYSFTGGLIAMYMWRSVYWSEQVSLRTRVLLAIDWAKRAIWGRDLSRF
ncbi:pyridine nucleotide-disulfide oxidoreductase-domain-containing protein [Protomyces lactucae-debilis]|uniref:Pyridine nucleotide-disulfide oxidoreductase-domain-containing protein n=1 Tax=Protomyces lactucae-debilis TaxID=2754530 RepID=A0A1Y2FT57_PROLT|nr:pyridine nucleotide-disulfide oxidoreductase-domain-containing protein [Protomyces lactucae-debilis]ORY87129.1 pyridine nucleotide-disulfide oxidoreductase-domain-containing protein [Protomyces lactucae-debilis]